MADPHSGHVEAALTFALPDDFVLPDFSDQYVPGPKEVEVTEVYWDTADRRLLRVGHTVCQRHASDGSVNGWVVGLAVPEATGPGPHGEETIDAVELHYEGGDRVPPAVRAVLRGTTGRAPLTRVAQTVSVQREVTVVGSAGQAEYLLTDHRATSGPTGEGDGDGIPLRHLTVRAASATTPAPESLTNALLAAGAVREASVPASLDILGGAPLPPAAPVLGPKATIEQLTRAALAGSTERLVRYDALVRADTSVEALHQARVATRRLRSDLQSLAPVLDALTVRRLRYDLGWLGSWLGSVRDNDVLAARFATLSKQVGITAGLEELSAQLQRERIGSRAELLGVLASARSLDLFEDLQRFSVSPPFTVDAKPDKRASRFSRAVAAKAFFRTARFARRLPESPTDDELHELRKRAKRARYAIELVAPVTDPAALRLAGRLSSLQDTLGGLQDGAVAQQWLRRATQRHSCSSDAAFLAGAFFEREQRRCTRARAHWREDWRACTRRDLLAWLK